MKNITPFFAIATLFALSLTPSLVRAQDVPPPPPSDDQSQGDQSDQGASFQTFYDQLGDQGTWVQTDDYGYVFQPNVTDPNWAPYSDGHWVYTDVGWTWVSDEPWGWATYHYGRWANIDGTGWVWIPGYRWAPAWVSWRYGGGYCGWAPLPPESFIGAEYGGSGGWASFHFGGDVDVNFNIGAGCYNFVAVGDMGEPNYRGHYIDRSRNYTVINNTTNITNINVAGGASSGFRGVSVGGPALADVNAHAREHVATVQLAAANQPGQSSLQGNSLAVYAPKVNPATHNQAKPANVARTIAHPTFNRGDSITKPLAVTASVRPPAPSAEAIQAAKTAQLHAPATAKIATAKTKVKTPITKPLTSLQPVTQTHATSAVSPGASSVNSNAKHSAASSPYTGEPANKPATTYHAPSEVAPAQTHPETEQKPAQTYHPETEQKPAPTYHPETEQKPAPTYHPQTEEKPAETYHPESAPAPTYHPESQATHEAPPQVHTQSAPAPASHPESAPNKPAPAKPAPGNGNNNPNQQNH
jgi:hypothetical protein